MHYIFPVRTRDVFILNPELRAVRAFDCLSTKQMTAVMLIADYYTPYRYILHEKGEKTLREAAARRVGYTTPKRDALSLNGKKIVNGEDECVEEAIRIYKLNQGTDYIDLMDRIEKKIRDFVDEDVSSKKPSYEAHMRLLAQFIDKGIMTKLAKERDKLLSMNIEIRKKMKQTQMDLPEGEIFDEEEEEDPTEELEEVEEIEVYNPD